MLPSVLPETAILNLPEDQYYVLSIITSYLGPNDEIDTLLNTTNIVSFKENAQQINQMICNILPIPEGKFFKLQAVDSVNSTSWDSYNVVIGEIGVFGVFGGTNGIKNDRVAGKFRGAILLKGTDNPAIKSISSNISSLPNVFFLLIDEGKDEK
ncbi:18948_t:CDS:2, partial [Funneliformis geosporum]